TYGGGRVVFESDLGYDGRHASYHVPRISHARVDGGRSLLCDSPFDRRHRVHRGIERRHDIAGPEDRFLGGFDAEKSADRNSRWSTGLGTRPRLPAYPLKQ